MQTMQNLQDSDMNSYEIFAERLNKVTFRDFSNNTRMDIKNVDLKAQQIKRDRAINYWQNNVIQNYLPHIDSRKKSEVDNRRAVNEPFSVMRNQSK